MQVAKVLLDKLSLFIVGAEADTTPVAATVLVAAWNFADLTSVAAAVLVTAWNFTIFVNYQIDVVVVTIVAVIVIVEPQVFVVTVTAAALATLTTSAAASITKVMRTTALQAAVEVDYVLVVVVFENFRFELFDCGFLVFHIVAVLMYF